ncbi:Uncharacterised protein [Megamonas hypermegale]|uniref:Uncharacterized protein n=1 Tax=Megamonas hypermegale TaxID=158847 RepID=A0A378NWC1_9FIRM|nr:hypothetical protein [Megamonas hypermegale]STY72175.1 Uncharacterised protein [Megamonas hypermegale]
MMKSLVVDNIGNFVNGTVNLLGKKFDAQTAKEIAIHESDNKLIGDVIKYSETSIVVLGFGVFIYKGMKYIVDNGNFNDLEVKVKDWFDFSLKADK